MWSVTLATHKPLHLALRMQQQRVVVVFFLRSKPCVDPICYLQTQCFITAMDALKLEQRAVDEVQPLIYDLSDRLNKVRTVQ